jgi:hypothetical protein
VPRCGGSGHQPRKLFAGCNLDSQTRSIFTEEEWSQKNQWFADNEGLELSTINVVVNSATSGTEVGVTVDRTFEHGTSITRKPFSSWRMGLEGTALLKSRPKYLCRVPLARISFALNSNGLSHRTYRDQRIAIRYTS